MVAVAILGQAEAAIPVEPVDGEAQPDRVLRLEMNNGAWILVEDLLGEAYKDTVAYLLTCAEIRHPETKELIRAGQHVKLSVRRALLFAATRLHHPELSMDDCGEMLLEHHSRLEDPIDVAVLRSLKLKVPEPGEARPAATSAESQTGTGKPSSTNISKPEDAPATS